MQDQSLRGTPNEISQCVPTLKGVEDAKKLFGQRLKAAREMRNLTQKELGKQLGITGNSVARIESGKHGPRWEILEKIFSFLGQSPVFYFNEQSPAFEPSMEQLKEIVENALKDPGLQDLVSSAVANSYKNPPHRPKRKE